MARGFAFAALLMLFATPARSELPPERGRYLVETIAVCTNCHTPKGPNGPRPDKKLAGGDVIKHQDFAAVVPNITPDPETGIGKWTDEEIILAIPKGNARTAACSARRCHPGLTAISAMRMSERLSLICGPYPQCIIRSLPSHGMI